MKKIITIFAILLVVPVLFLGCNGDNDGVLSVSDVQHDPLAFTGEITIGGRVDERSQNSFGIVDPAIRACCDAFLLIVRYDGDTPIPAIGANVRLTGSWLDERTNDGFPIFGVTSFVVR